VDNLVKGHIVKIKKNNKAEALVDKLPLLAAILLVIQILKCFAVMGSKLANNNHLKKGKLAI